MFSDKTQDPKLAKPLPRMSTPKYVPKEGDDITIDLPNERTRAVIERVISDTAVIAKLKQYTTAFHSHPYKKDDLVACQYEEMGMHVWGWRVLSERELAEAEAAAAAPVEEVAAETPPPPAPAATKGKKGNAVKKG